MRERDVLLTGVPRSGTSLACALLNKLSDVLALNEPLEPKWFPAPASREAICDEIDRFLGEARRAAHNGRALTRHLNGRFSDNNFADRPDADGLRSSVIRQSEITLGKALCEGFWLVVKDPAPFTALLPELARRFRLLAMVRNPLAVLGSWNSIRAPVEQGRVPSAERLDPRLRSDLASIADTTERQLHILSWFFERYLRHLPPSAVLRYEDTVATGGGSLAPIVPGAASLTEPLRNRNGSALYQRETLRRLGERLLRSDGAYWHFYSRESVEELLAG